MKVPVSKGIWKNVKCGNLWNVPKPWLCRTPVKNSFVWLTFVTISLINKVGFSQLFIEKLSEAYSDQLLRLM